MGYVQTLFFVLAFASFNYVQSTKVCTLTDTECTKKAAQRLLVKLVPGVPSLFGPLDPLSLPEHGANNINFNYTISNSSLVGIGQCLVDVFRINPDDSTFYAEMQCPKLVLKYNYDIKGFLGAVETEGQGRADVNLNDYYIIIKGAYGQFISEKDQKLHFTIVNYVPTFKPRGPVTIDAYSPLHSDPAKDALAKEFATKTGVADVEEMIRVMVMPQYFRIFMNNMDTYMREVAPVDEIFTE